MSIRSLNPAHRHSARQQQALGEIGDTDPRGWIAGRQPLKPNGSRTGFGESEQHSQGAGLAGAVGTQQPERRAGGEREVDIAKRVALAVALGDADEF